MRLHMLTHLVLNADISQFAHINANAFAFIKLIVYAIAYAIINLIAHASAFAIIKNQKRNTKMCFSSNQTCFHL